MSDERTRIEKDLDDIRLAMDIAHGYYLGNPYLREGVAVCKEKRP